VAKVVDANLALALVLGTPYCDWAQALWERWASAQTVVFAPDLWAYEVTSALREAMVITGVTLAEAETRLETLTPLGIRLVPPTPAFDRSSRWAQRLERTVAYDAHYLALAEVMACEFWTADRCLAARLTPDVRWVPWVGQVNAA
jgi:predicted nucleic acid-binding protein